MDVRSGPCECASALSKPFSTQDYICDLPNFRSSKLSKAVLPRYEGTGASQVVLVVKNPPANAGDLRDTGSIPVSEDPLEEDWQLTPVVLPGESPWTEEPGRL